MKQGRPRIHFVGAEIGTGFIIDGIAQDRYITAHCPDCGKTRKGHSGAFKVNCLCKKVVPTTTCHCGKEHRATTQCPRCARRDFQKRRMKTLYAAMGGAKCSQCGYDKCEAALDFHHIGPKTGTISRLFKESLEKVLAEAENCILLCSNCHREYHHGDRELVIPRYRPEKPENLVGLEGNAIT